MARDMDELITFPGFNDDDDDASAAPAARVPRARARSPWWRRRGPIIGMAIVLLLILLGALFLTVLRRQGRGQLEYTQATRGNFALTVSATGPIQSGTYNVTFSGTGKIAEIDVSVGQSVTQGQVLAKMDKTSLQDAVNEAQASVLAAQTGVNNAQNTFGKTASQSQAAVVAAQTTLNNAKTSLGNTQSQSMASVAAAQTALSNAQTSLTRIEAESTASIATAQTALTNAQANLTAVQKQAQQQITVAKDQETSAINACGKPGDPGYAACKQTAIDQYNQAVATANASVTNAQNQVSSAQKQLSSAQTQAAANNTQAQAAINTAVSQLNTAQAQSNSNNAQAQGQVNTAQSQLNTALANADSSNTTAQGQISTAQAQFNTAQVQLQTAQHNLANATLTAPHDGIVTVVNGSVGGTPGASASSSTATSGSAGTFIQIVDVSALQVLADVNESDTSNLKVGEPVLFTVSAYSNRTFRGTVSAISPNGQTVSNVVTYPVYIDVDMNNLQGASLLPGMTANVTINVIQRPNVVLIPVNAVNFARAATGTTNTPRPLITQDQANVALDQARQMLSSLQLQNPNVSNDNPVPAFVLESGSSNGQYIARPVVLGLTDDTEYVVLAGLSPGETIIAGVQTGGSGGVRPITPGGAGG